LQSVADAIAKHCLLTCKETLTRGMFKYLTLPKDSPNLDKDTIWKKLVDEGMMAPVTLAHTKGKDAVRPIIMVKKKLLDIVITQCPVNLQSFQEAYDINSLNAYLSRCAHRHTNSAIIQNYFTTYLASLQSQLKSRRGKTSFADKATIDHLQTEAAKHKSMEDSAASIGQKLFNSSDAPPKRRKLLSKRSDIRV
jgi:predicted acylesterase/phospholipase RssA